MGILGRILNRPRSDTVAENGQYIPASAPQTPAAAGRGSAILDRAGRFYRENPRKVQALGLVAAAMLLTRMGQRRR
jgi:hypothetical protein